MFHISSKMHLAALVLSVHLAWPCLARAETKTVPEVSAALDAHVDSQAKTLTSRGLDWLAGDLRQAHKETARPKTGSLAKQSSKQHYTGRTDNSGWPKAFTTFFSKQDDGVATLISSYQQDDLTKHLEVKTAEAATIVVRGHAKRKKWIQSRETLSTPRGWLRHVVHVSERRTVKMERNSGTIGARERKPDRLASEMGSPTRDCSKGIRLRGSGLRIPLPHGVVSAMKAR